jgi:hypothetical protein
MNVKASASEITSGLTGLRLKLVGWFRMARFGRRGAIANNEGAVRSALADAKWPTDRQARPDPRRVCQRTAEDRQSDRDPQLTGEV